MKKLLTAIAITAAVALTGCATSTPVGSLYTQVKLPVAVTQAQAGSTKLKVGKAECKSILGLVATGDASIDTAAKNAGITVIHHVDWEAENILGIIGTYRCVVYGE